MSKQKNIMTFAHEIVNKVLCLRLEGDLIGENNGPEIMEIAGSALKNGTDKCLINLEAVRYINSSGIGVLITLLTKFRNQGGELVLVNPSEHVNKLLIIIKLRNIFIIAQSEEEALQKLKN
jgi:anti-sigma B factor antagonist